MPSSREILAFSRIDRATPAEFLVVLYILLATLNSLVATSVPRRLLVAVGVLLLGYEAIGFRSMKHEQYFLYVVGMWIAAALTLNGVVFGEWVQESVYLPGNIAVALALCRGHLGRRTTEILLYGAAVYFGYRLLTVPNPGAIHEILHTGSANGISALMLMLCGLHYAVSRAKGAPIRVMPAVACLLVSAVTLGRSAMTAAAFLLVGVAARDLVLERSWRRFAAKFAVYGGLTIAVLIVVLPRLDAISFVFERFSEYGLESEGRNRIWSSYRESLGGPGVLTGYGRNEIFGGFTNVHNSYVLWHKSMGVMAIPLYLLAVLALLRALVRDWMLFVILTPLLFRAFFDEMILPFRLYDFLFYYLVCTILVTLSAERQSYRLLRTAET